MHGPTGTFWANLTAFSLKRSDDGVLCLPCPAGCARSEKLEGGLIVRPGYGVSSHVAAQQRPLRDVGGARSLFRCPVAAACLGEAALDGAANSSGFLQNPTSFHMVGSSCTSERRAPVSASRVLTVITLHLMCMRIIPFSPH